MLVLRLVYGWFWVCIVVVGFAVYCCCDLPLVFEVLWVVITLWFVCVLFVFRWCLGG